MKVIHNFDGMAWPVPNEAAGDVEYALRYGKHPNLIAASICNAYRALIFKPQRERNRIIAKLRKLAGTTTGGTGENTPGDTTGSDQLTVARPVPGEPTNQEGR